MGNAIKLTKVSNHYNYDMAAATLHAQSSTFPLPLFTSVRR